MKIKICDNKTSRHGWIFSITCLKSMAQQANNIPLLVHNQKVGNVSKAYVRHGSLWAEIDTDVNPNDYYEFGPQGAILAISNNIIERFSLGAIVGIKDKNV